MRVLYSSSLALIMMLGAAPNERLRRGGAVMMRACGSAKRQPFLPDARIKAALPNACRHSGRLASVDACARGPSLHTCSAMRPLSCAVGWLLDRDA